MKLPIFVQAASDPTLIPGVYDTCDQWCMYCPVSNRCLAYRCNADQSGSANISRRLADRLFEGLTFLKKLCEAEGRPTTEIDAMLSNDPRGAGGDRSRRGRRAARIHAGASAQTST
jgi:hypothetical protein